MLLLGVPNIITGGWAVTATQHWFDNFPGWAPQLVAAYPPYNEHLSFDAGSGLFASGVLMVLAALWPRREVVIASAIGYLAFVSPHFLYHLLTPSELLTTAENTSTTISLALNVVGGAAVLMWQRRLEVTAD